MAAILGRSARRPTKNLVPQGGIDITEIHILRPAQGGMLGTFFGDLLVLLTLGSGSFHIPDPGKYELAARVWRRPKGEISTSGWRRKNRRIED